MCWERGKEILENNWDKVERMVNSLLEYETVDTEEVRAIVENRPYVRDPEASAPRVKPASPENKPAEEPKRISGNITPEPA